MSEHQYGEQSAHERSQIRVEEMLLQLSAFDEQLKRFNAALGYVHAYLLSISEVVQSLPPEFCVEERDHLKGSLLPLYEESKLKAELDLLDSSALVVVKLLQQMKELGILVPESVDLEVPSEKLEMMMATLSGVYPFIKNMYTHKDLFILEKNHTTDFLEQMEEVLRVTHLYFATEEIDKTLHPSFLSFQRMANLLPFILVKAGHQPVAVLSDIARANDEEYKKIIERQKLRNHLEFNIGLLRGIVVLPLDNRDRAYNVSTTLENVMKTIALIEPQLHEYTDEGRKQIEDLINEVKIYRANEASGVSEK